MYLRGRSPVNSDIAVMGERKGFNHRKGEEREKAQETLLRPIERGNFLGEGHRR